MTSAANPDGGVSARPGYLEAYSSQLCSANQTLLSDAPGDFSSAATAMANLISDLEAAIHTHQLVFGIEDLSGLASSSLATQDAQAAAAATSAAAVHQSAAQTMQQRLASNPGADEGPGGTISSLERGALAEQAAATASRQAAEQDAAKVAADQAAARAAAQNAATQQALVAKLTTLLQTCLEFSLLLPSLPFALTEYAAGALSADSHVGAVARAIVYAETGTDTGQLLGLLEEFTGIAGAVFSTSEANLLTAEQALNPDRVKGTSIADQYIEGSVSAQQAVALLGDSDSTTKTAFLDELAKDHQLDAFLGKSGDTALLDDVASDKSLSIEFLDEYEKNQPDLWNLFPGGPPSENPNNPAPPGPNAGPWDTAGSTPSAALAKILQQAAGSPDAMRGGLMLSAAYTWAVTPSTLRTLILADIDDFGFVTPQAAFVSAQSPPGFSWLTADMATTLLQTAGLLPTSGSALSGIVTTQLSAMPTCTDGSQQCQTQWADWSGASGRLLGLTLYSSQNANLLNAQGSDDEAQTGNDVLSTVLTAVGMAPWDEVGIAALGLTSLGGPVAIGALIIGLAASHTIFAGNDYPTALSQNADAYNQAYMSAVTSMLYVARSRGVIPGPRSRGVIPGPSADESESQWLTDWVDAVTAQSVPSSCPVALYEAATSIRENLLRDYEIAPSGS